MSDTLRLLPDPDCPYSEIAAVLTGAGMIELDGVMALPPLVAGEPEFAVWLSPDAETSAEYSYDPVTGLRTIELRGEGAIACLGQIASRLASLGPPALAELLRSSDPRQQLCGIRGSVALGAVGLLGAIEGLRTGPDRHVTAAAAGAVEELTGQLLECGERRLAEKGGGDIAVGLFRALPEPAARRAALLKLSDREIDAGNADALLAAGLEDNDWQVQAAAMLLATRLGRAGLWSAIRAIDFARSGRSGLNRSQRDILAAARRAALDHLAGKTNDHSGHPKAALLDGIDATVAGHPPAAADPLLDWLKGLGDPA
jgi:hypothetical protein